MIIRDLCACLSACLLAFLSLTGSLEDTDAVGCFSRSSVFIMVGGGGGRNTQSLTAGKMSAEGGSAQGRGEFITN